MCTLLASHRCTLLCGAELLVCMHLRNFAWLTPLGISPARDLAQSGMALHSMA